MKSPALRRSNSPIANIIVNVTGLWRVKGNGFRLRCGSFHRPRIGYGGTRRRDETADTMVDRRASALQPRICKKFGVRVFRIFRG